MTDAHELAVVEGDREIIISGGGIEIVVCAPIALGYDEIWEFGADAATADRILKDSAGEVEATEHLSDAAAVELLECSVTTMARGGS